MNFKVIEYKIISKSLNKYESDFKTLFEIRPTSLTPLSEMNLKEQRVSLLHTLYSLTINNISLKTNIIEVSVCIHVKSLKRKVVASLYVLIKGRTSWTNFE